MMVRVGNFLFHHRNGIFPFFYGLLIFKSQPLMPDYRLAAVLGLLVAASGQLLRAVTVGLEYIIRGGKDRQVYAEKLVEGGVFAHCRNPLYLGNVLIVVGVGLAANSVLFFSIAVPFFLFAYRAIIAAEENYLSNKFGAKFDAYCHRVNRLIPNFCGFSNTLAGMRFNWRRLITAEYGSAYIWMAAITLVSLKNVWQNGHYDPSHQTVRALWTLFLMLNLAYALARLLKKAGLLKASRRGHA